MTGEARLRNLRLIGFKSFAERTTLEFGPGISAIVGPNGSGKSNLADALRWALGEQGRALRTRKSEDVIFAGSATRRAIGLAEVTLTLENGDGLLPIAYSEVGLARRLYRSGENEYLMNGQHVRLRDVLDLLDGANLADNAFLFIGQGMVDQALSLRPEERRPLFEEAAGVRRHERRRRQAEGRLEEAEDNLARVRDIATELRPQVRRLAQQAEQQAAREDAGQTLAAALVASLAARWQGAAAALAAADSTVHEGRLRAEGAAAALAAAEAETTTLLASLADRAALAREQRHRLEAARQALTEQRVADERRAAESEAADRERARLHTERAAAEERLDEARRTLALVEPSGGAAPASTLATDLAALDLQIAQAAAELAAVKDQHRAADARDASLARASQARRDEASRLRLRASATETRAADAVNAAVQAADVRVAAERTAAERASVLAGAARDLAAARSGRDAAALAEEDAQRVQRNATAARSGQLDELAALRERLATATVASEGADAALVAAARKTGGRPLVDGLDVVPALRVAVEAALGTALRAAVVARAEVPRLRTKRGHLAVRLEAATARDRDARASLAAAQAVAGGSLVDALRQDPTGVAAQLLRLAVWVPTLDAALAVSADLPDGWQVVTVDGDVVTAAGLIRLGRPDALLDQRAALDRTQRQVTELEGRVESARAAAEAAAAHVAATGRDLEAADAELARAAEAFRVAEAQERAAQRGHDTALREAAWTQAQAERLRAEHESAAAALTAVGDEPAGPDGRATPGSAPDAPDAAAAMAWAARLAGLRERRGVLADDLARATREQQAAEDRRRRAELAVSMESDRLASLEARLAEVGTAAAAGATDLTARRLLRSAAETAVAEAEAQERRFEAAEVGDRKRLAAAEHRALDQRTALHAADEAARRAEVAQVESRLGLEGIREAALTELAGLGALGIGALRAAAGEPAAAVAATVTGARDDIDHDADGGEALPAEIERALEAAARRWAATRPPASAGDVPSPTQLAALRRRYHEIGASNPFAVEEHAELQGRLAALDTQRHDLERAISDTQRLIAELSDRISDQFQRTFAALERAFGRRFGQLFGGGEAQLLLTDPLDLASTGIEIMARPPGKKRQALAMLSGGERALTAVALLFAMLDVHPVPFCVLDEVDAALDEANVGRFVEALRELAVTTQFLVITHNRGTIEAADALYGITIGDDAISRVISLRLAEATELAGAVS